MTLTQDPPEGMNLLACGDAPKNVPIEALQRACELALRSPLRLLSDLSDAQVLEHLKEVVTAEVEAGAQLLHAGPDGLSWIRLGSAPISGIPEMVWGDLFFPDAASTLSAAQEALSRAGGARIFAETAAHLTWTEAALEGLGWQRYGVVVEHSTIRPPGRPDPRVRLAGPDDWGFVLECLADAHWMALSENERRVTDPQAARDLVEKTYGGSLNEYLCLVIEEPSGAPCGHHTLAVDELDRCLGYEIARTIDTYVVAGQAGQGLSKILTHAAQHACADAGVKAMTGTVVLSTTAGGAGPGVLAQLARGGWQITRSMWVSQ